MKFVNAIFFFGLIVICQAQNYDIDLELKSKYGFLIAHRPIMSHIPKEHTFGVEFNFIFQTKGSKTWHTSLNFPKFGLSLVGSNSGNKELLGNYYGAYSFLQFPFLKTNKNQLYGKVGTGIGIIEKVFDQEKNPKNIAMSSHVNALINFGLFYEHRFKKSHFNLGLDLTHLSNGASKMPNLGLNLPYITFGFGKRIKQSEINFNTNYDVLFNKNWSYLIIGIASFKEAYPTGGEKYKVFASCLHGQKIYSHKLGYEVGFDFIYNPSIKTYKPVISKSDENIFQFAIYNGYVMTLEKLQIAVGLGVYIRDEFLADEYFYNRVGLRYFFSNKFFGNLTLKSHWAKADYVEYGIGFRI